MLLCHKDELMLYQKGRQSYCVLIQTDSDVVIEEGEGDFKERCIIIKGEERNVEEEAEQADDEQSEQLTEAGTKPGTSLITEQ